MKQDFGLCPLSKAQAEVNARNHEVKVNLRPVRQLRSSRLRVDIQGMLAYNIGVAKPDCSARLSSAFGVLDGSH